MTASQGNVAELEHLGVRANTLEGDVRIPSSRGLQICAMALGASTQPWELRVPIVEMVVYADIPCLHLPDTLAMLRAEEVYCTLLGWGV